MGIKISELPLQSTELAAEFQIPMIDDTPETKRVGFETIANYMQTIPYNTFNNGSSDITLGNWGMQEAGVDCSELYQVDLPSPSSFPSKILILRNANVATNIPISGVLTLDGPLNVLQQSTSMICFSNGANWLVISFYSL